MVYGDFGDFRWFWVAKNKAKQSQFAELWPETRSTKPKIRNELNGCDLKKQSQFILY